MAITKHGYGAIAMATIGTIYNVIALVMPMWTVNKTVNSALTSEVTSTNFKAGLMGFCVDSELTNSSTTLDHCFYYKFGSTYDDLSVLNDKIWSTYGGSGICAAYSDAGDVSDATQLEYATVLATAAGMNAEQFDKFLDKSCGLLGTATMSFCGMSMSNGLMAIITFIATMTCFQAKPLGEDDDTSLKMAFFLMIVAVVHYLLAVYMFQQQQKLQVEKGTGDEQSTFILEASDSQGGSRAYM
ncbi:hypothetical protein JM16_009864 [Phytophthora kernoviae]|uniref:Uncharacterized protein n=1 Tax=Phytophthora kernoviae TaxID=325452 RepID=A0A8T0LFC0_9STRA|nr:hypothetical protein JM16_009864 [Phytophthora kernoviae]